MPSRPTFILSTSALAALALAAPASAAAASPPAASPPAPIAEERLLGGLLGGILDPIVGPILGGGGSEGTPAVPVDTSVVGSLVTALLGSTPLGEDALTGVVTGLLGGGVPAELPIVSDLLDTILATSGGTLPVVDVVGALLADGVALELVPSVLAQVLGSSGASPDLVAALVEGAVGELLVAGLPADPAALTGLLGILGGGTPATGALLAPVADLLDALAANPIVPAELRATIASLSAQVRASGGGLLAGDLLGAVGGLLENLGAATGGTSSPLSPILAGLGRILVGQGTGAIPTLGGPGTGPSVIVLPQPGGGTTSAPARFRPTRAMRATVRRVRVSKTRRTVKATLKCPSAAVLGCAVTSRIRYRGRDVGKSKTIVMLPSTTRSVSLRVPAARSRTMKRRGGRVYVRAQSHLGSMAPRASRSVQVKKVRAPAKKRARR